MIEFTINGDTYQAEEGMTWGEWAESKYNITSMGITAINIWNGHVYGYNSQNYFLREKGICGNILYQTDIINPIIEYEVGHCSGASN